VLWYLCTRRNRLPILRLREFAGPRFRRLVRPLYYEAIRRRRALPGGAYLFSDLEILDPRPLAAVRRIAARLREHEATVLNDPSRALGRYALLRRLFRDGVNDFDVYRLDEGRVPERWPVFLRGERDHKGPRSGLLADAAALAAHAGADPAADLVVELADCRDPDGLHRKYGACRVGDRVFARHLFFETHWMVKMREEAGPARLAEERAFVEEFPDRAEVEAIFRTAQIEYGRIDYGRRDGRIQVWEINTNPTIISPETTAMRNRWPMNEAVIRRHADALLSVAERARGRPAIALRGVRGVRPRWWAGRGATPGEA